MSKHPLDPVSLAFGIVFGVMAFTGLGTMAGIIDNGLVVALAGTIVALAATGTVCSARRLRRAPDGHSRPDPTPDDHGPVDPHGSEQAEHH